MIKLDKVVIVEGKYDKIHLENIIDAPIITTEGFGIFKDKKKLSLIKKLAEKNGIVILTDSDSAGCMIRSYLKGCISADKITNVYLPEILGKEKRKSKPGKQGLLGVEGIDKSVLVKAFERAGLFCSRDKECKKKITDTDLYDFGLSGKSYSKKKRAKLLELLDLPTALSKNSMLTVINTIFSYEEFVDFISKKTLEMSKDL